MRKILVVDADRRNLKLLITVLEHGNYEVLGANCAADGVTLALQQQPDVIFMDVQMPVVDGIAALKQLRADSRTAALRVFALTALAMKGDAQRMLAEGFDGYYEKPIQYKNFLKVVSQLFDDACSGRVQ